MKKNSVMVKQVLTGILTAGALVFGFASCSDEDIMANESINPEMEREYDGPALETYGLSYMDFITDNDIMILDADTTQLSISKALADKLGIQSFVGHPMGILHDIDHDSYMRKATKEKLVGDRYILDVVPATLAEVLKGQEMRLSTDLYVNQDAEQTRTRAAELNIPEYAAKYVDDNNMIHPIAVTITPAEDGEQSATRNGIMAFGTYSTDDIWMARQNGSRWWPYDQIKDVVDKVGDAVEDVVDVVKDAAKDVYNWVDDKTQYNVCEYRRDCSLININTEFEKKIEFGVGKAKKKGEKVDTMNVNIKAPINFGLNYTFILDAKGSLVSLPDFNRFETGVGGTFDFNPTVTIGFSKAFSIPEDKERLKLYSFPAFKFKFFIGPVPVTIDIYPYIFMKFDAKVEGSAYMGVNYHYASNFKLGAYYTKSTKWQFYSDHKVVDNKVSIIPPTAELAAHAGVGLMLGADVVVEKVAGPKLAIGPKLTADANMKFSPWSVEEPYKFTTSIDCGVNGEIGAVLKVLGWDIAEMHKDIDFGLNWNLFKFEYPKANGGDQKGENTDKLARMFEQKTEDIQKKALDEEIAKWKKQKESISQYDRGSISLVKKTVIDYTRFDMELASYMNKNLDMFVLVVEKVAYEQIMANNKKLPPVDDVIKEVKKQLKGRI